MGNHELRRKETVESPLEKNNSSKSQESSSTIYDRAKKGVGIAFAGALKAAEATLKVTTVGLAVRGVSGLDGAHALSQSNASDTALAHRNGGSRDGDNATALHLDQKGLSHPSNQTNLDRNLSKVTPELLEHLGKFVNNPEQFIQNAQKRDHNLQQRDQKREQRQEMRRIMEKAQEDPKVLESLRKLFEEMPGKKSSETSRRKLDVPGPCLQSGPPPTDPPTLVTGTVSPVEGGGTAVRLTYDLNTRNACLDTITNVQFSDQKVYTCPAGCTETSGTKESFVAGYPSTINSYGVSTASKVEDVFCIQTDSNGGETPVAPTSLTVTLQPTGMHNGAETLGAVNLFTII